MVAVRLRGQVTADRQLRIELPESIPNGLVEVIVLHEAPAKRPLARRTKRKAAHPGFGIWAKRQDISDSATFAGQLRERITIRRIIGRLPQSG